MEIKTTAHTQLKNWIAEQLRNSILDGRFKPGEWLRQERLAQEYGVSQMPVREALKELVGEGLLEHVPYRGIRVVSLSAEDIEDLYDTRAFLEGRAVRAAAARITPEELAELREIQTQMQEHLDQPQLAAYRDLNRRFHRVIYLASRHNYLIRSLNQMWEAFPSMLWSNLSQTAVVAANEQDNDRHEHNAIIAALTSQDGDEAERLMRNHIGRAGRHLVTVLKAAESAGNDLPPPSA